MSLSASAVARPKDAAAKALAKKAMQEDYLGTHFKQAEQKLKKALKQCGRGCSASVRAELHRDLAVVYIEGLNRKKDGKREMQAAVKADAELQLDPDFTTRNVEKVFVAAGGVPKVEERDSAKLEEEEPAPVAAAPAEAEGSEGAPRNWFSLGFQQDLLSYRESTGVCSGAAQYQCFLQGERYDAPIYRGSGNQLQGGLGLATKRVLLGYERLLGENITLGIKLGYAFGGRPTAKTGDTSAFFPLHAELRASYWFGSAPLASGGLRGYAGLAAGMSEVDGHVSVEYFSDEAGYRAGKVGKLDAWRKTGKLMVALHGGLGYAFARQHALLLELRALQLLGDAALGGAVGVGYTVGM